MEGSVVRGSAYMDTENFSEASQVSEVTSNGNGQWYLALGVRVGHVDVEIKFRCPSIGRCWAARRMPLVQIDMSPLNYWVSMARSRL